MFYLLHSVTASDVFKRQLPPLLLAFGIAELLYKFHSFTLECGAFLLTWYAIDAVARWAFPKRAPTSSAE